MKRTGHVLGAFITVFIGAMVISLSSQEPQPPAGSVEVVKDGQQLFERETFGGNGRTCLTCHSRDTGTISPQDASSASSRTLAIRSSWTTEVMTHKATV